MTARPAMPRRPLLLLLLLAVLLTASALWLPWNLETLGSWAELRLAGDRVAKFLAAFLVPDLGAELLLRGLHMALETVAVALLGTALGLLLAWPLALGSCRAVVLADEPAHGLGGAARRLLLQACRLLLDVLRGVPDFAWAIVLANFTGTSAVTGLLAIGISIAGILGKVLGEQWDSIDPRRYAALRSTGAGRLAVFCYGVQPLAARAMLSFVLMRAECAVRNASVIGVVGGGGLGAGLWDEYADGNWSRVATMLLFMLAITATADLLANFLRYQLRVDPNHPRVRRTLEVRASTRRRAVGAAAVFSLCCGSLLVLAEPLGRLPAELWRLETGFVVDYTTSLLLLPDLSAATLLSAVRESTVPLAIGLLATGAAALAAGLLSFPASVAFQLEAARFTGERPGAWMRARRLLAVTGARGLGLLLRGIPEVAWVVLLSVFFRAGLTPCAFAIALHSTGVLLRVFTETVDNVPYRRLEQVSGTCRPQIFLYGALPEAAADWKTYVFFQFEVNVRTGVVLGMVGAGGLGDKFHSNLLFRDNHRAGTYLWAMVLLTLVIDRVSRRLLLRRLKC